MTQEEFDKAPKIEQVLYDCTGMLAKNHSDIIEAMTLYAESEVKKFHKPPVTSNYDAEDMKEAYEYGKGYGTGNFDEWLKNRNCW